jgi:hypothetical protein
MANSNRVTIGLVVYARGQPEPYIYVRGNCEAIELAYNSKVNAFSSTITRRHKSNRYVSMDDCVRVQAIIE